ncbi:MAG: TRAM domain-containing protein, partial [Acidobacteriota bacterium]
MKTNPNQPERATTIHVGEDHDVTIEKIVYGGDGLARLGPFILFVPFTAPGDVVRVRITSVDRSIARGVIEQMISPAPTRQQPPCRHFGVCGGCQLQHLAYPIQLEVKSAFVRESLRRLGGIDWPGEIPILSGPDTGYRTRAELKIGRTADLRPRFG